MKRVLKWISRILIVVLVLATLYLGPVTVMEYRPDEVETVELSTGARTIGMEDEITLISWNIGYGALSKTEDFFMDGGEKVNPEEEGLVQDNLSAIAEDLALEEADFYLLQEVDTDSKRSFHIDEKAYLEDKLDRDGMFALNFKVFYTPYPIPTIGKVESGLLTLTDIKPRYAERISLPVSFSWPIRTCQMKRCLLVSRYGIEGMDQELVVVNLHLEAYDSGEGKIAQTKVLVDLLNEEYAKGNYVIAGGDFNQLFDVAENYDIHNEEDWQPGNFSQKDLPEHFKLAVADNAPTCRLLNHAYTGDYDTTQVYIIDGFIVSDNLQVDLVEVLDKNFENTDHNPVKLQVSFAR